MSTSRQSPVMDEPEYIDFNSTDPIDIGKIVAWAKWAKNRIETLEAINLTEVQGRQRAETTIAQQAEAIKGFESWQRLKKPGLEVFEIGQEILIIAPNIKAKVVAVIIDRAGINYEVCWWSGGLPTVVLFPAADVQIIDDHLPIPGKEDTIVCSIEQQMLDKMNKISEQIKRMSSRQENDR